MDTDQVEEKKYWDSLKTIGICSVLVGVVLVAGFLFGW